jgi:hypothetical protein
MAQTVILIYRTSNGPPDHVEYRGKFVQLALHGVEYLIFAPAELHRFHNQILAQFLMEQNIPHRWVNGQTLEMAESDLVVIGGGKFRVNTGSRILELWDNSQAYGRFDGHGLPERIASAGHPWSGFDIGIS